MPTNCANVYEFNFAFAHVGQLVGLMNIILMGCVFGPIVPWLLILIPFTVVSSYCASAWLESLPQAPESKDTFGQRVAANVMIQQPTTIIAQLGLPMSWLICVSTMWDLEFSYGALLLYGLLNAALLCVVMYQKHYFWDSNSFPDQFHASAEGTVWFNSHEGVSTITFCEDTLC